MIKIIKGLYSGVATCFGSTRHWEYALENDLVMPNYHR